MMCSEEFLTFPFPVQETGFTSTDLEEFFSFFQSSPNSDAIDSESSPQILFPSNSGSDDPTNGFEEEMAEKKKRRKISNRESARRSRWRKKTYLEKLTAQANRLKAQNREYNTRLGLALDRLRAVKTQNELMRFECVLLAQRHADLNRVLQAGQYSQFNDKIVTNNYNTGSDRFADGSGLFSTLQRYAC